MGSDVAVEERIVTRLAKILKIQPSEVQKEARLIEDLEIDSLDILELIFELEEEFNIEIPQDKSPFVTVQDVITYVQEKTKGG